VAGGSSEKEYVMQGLRPRLGVGLAMIAALVRCGGSAAQPAVPETSPAPTVAVAPEPTATPPARVEPTTKAKPEPDAPPFGSSLNRIMQAHFKDALLIREAVIAGTPEEAVSPAAVLSHTRNLDQLPEGWQGFVAHMQQVAGRIQDSTSSAGAAAATADLGVSCGLCHQQHGGPRASSEPAPAAGTTVESRMKRHVWATERLWEGLYVPSNEAWNAGAKALAGEPFPQEVLTEGGVHGRSAAGDFARLAAKAPQKKTIEARAALYAELLVTCGACHQSLKGSH
jgi:cytochrome c553